MDSTGQLEDVVKQIRLTEQKVIFVRELALSLQQPTLAHLKVLHDYQMDAYSQHLEDILRFPDDAVDEQEEASDSFEELFHEVSRVMAKKHSAARRSSAPTSSAADQLAAEAWLKQQIKAREFLKVDVPEKLDEKEESRNQILKNQEVGVAETPSEFGTDSSRARSSNQPTLNDSWPEEEPTNNPSADTSDSTDVANHGPQPLDSKRADSVDQPAFIRRPNDVTARASRDRPLPATNLGHAEGGSKAKPGPDPARVPGIRNEPRGRVHPDSGHSTKAIEEHDRLLPSMVKTLDKRGHPRPGRFHPDYGANPRAVPSDQPDRSQQPRERQRKVWHSTVPPDKPSKVNKDQLPDLTENLLSYLNRGEDVRFHRSRNPTCDPDGVRPCAHPSFDS